MTDDRVPGDDDFAGDDPKGKRRGGAGESSPPPPPELDPRGRRSAPPPRSASASGSGSEQPRPTQGGSAAERAAARRAKMGRASAAAGGSEERSAAEGGEIGPSRTGGGESRLSSGGGSAQPSPRRTRRTGTTDPNLPTGRVLVVTMTEIPVNLRSLRQIQRQVDAMQTILDFSEATDERADAVRLNPNYGQRPKRWRRQTADEQRAIIHDERAEFFGRTPFVVERMTVASPLVLYLIPTGFGVSAVSTAFLWLPRIIDRINLSRRRIAETNAAIKEADAAAEQAVLKAELTGLLREDLANRRAELLSDVRVREALNRAIDQAADGLLQVASVGTTDQTQLPPIPDVDLGRPPTAGR